MYLIEFERCQVKQGNRYAAGMAVRILDPTADDADAKVLAEAVFTGDPGVTLTGDQDIAVLKLPLTSAPKGASSHATNIRS